jgi:hypothetical protein
VLVGGAVLGAAGAMTVRTRRGRLRRARPDFHVQRHADEGTVSIDESRAHASVAIGVTSWPDDEGAQSLEDAGP